MAVEAIVISVTMVFALASNIYGHNIQIALADTKNNNSPTRTSSSSSNPNQMSSSPAASSSSTDKATKLVLALRDSWAHLHRMDSKLHNKLCCRFARH